MTNLKYPQEISAEMQRFRDSNGNCYLDKDNKCILVRNKTKIYFGQDNLLIGTVFMTNPGSYGLNKISEWDKFTRGVGTPDILEGKGSPDLTMQNIINVIQESYKIANKKIPNGFVEIYNISSVVCPKGENLLTYHDKVIKIIKNHKLNANLLVNPVLQDKQIFIDTCTKTPFIIMGFVRGIFNDKIDIILDWSHSFKNKTVVSLDNIGWPSHPRRWRTEVALKNKIINNLSSIL